MTAMRDLVQRARSGGLRSSELSSPTVTVTSLGERGAETVIGIIYPPQVAIIGFGSDYRPGHGLPTDGSKHGRWLRSASPPTTDRAMVMSAPCW